MDFSYGTINCPVIISNGKLYGILPLANQKVSYSEVVDCGAVSQADLFRRARLWTAYACRSVDYTVSLSDKETGDLVGQLSQVVRLPRSDYSAGGVNRFQCSVIIECANRKYRVTITHLDVQEAGGKSTPIEVYCQKNEADLKATYTILDQQLKAQLSSLQEHIKNYKSF